ncbi:hypothetical protein Cst_c17450 [Thermoclostridium stercorarium subsp. stercorarium DSM 8532]|jgi:hypothetical protein|uniref:Uncharacterized protein n=3 Tax=Thermoclostridium stercorarium TaxID=1510 RepID=L7VKS2_THES1|nr:hypothetical protein Cst_c17450 [Thermoclostridium stercorarium subsp. stercorarium DSM 8532]ANW99057.1 hypothetical protein CSTERTH_08460 [Thermoclostridium stercorarium subsp. thermolacticum DSM 2910]ANX01585.1 hypothetical protein CSTERLE_08360 [Thermoclostridium stercorarium subsp. leptospartum DSM 9219]
MRTCAVPFAIERLERFADFIEARDGEEAYNLLAERFRITLQDLRGRTCKLQRGMRFWKGKERDILWAIKSDMLIILRPKIFKENNIK